MNEEKKVPFKWEYGEETISLQLGMYANNQRLYIGMITHTEDGAEAFADMTVNLPGYSLDPGEAFISGDISKDLLRFIKENKLGKVLPYQVQSGYGKYSAVAFDLEKTALFLIMSDTDDSFNFLISMCYTQLFNLLCEKADDVYGGRLPIHVRCLIDECANIGQIPKLEKLVATIRSREISACLVLQAGLPAGRRADELSASGYQSD